MDSGYWFWGWTTAMTLSGSAVYGARLRPTQLGARTLEPGERRLQRTPGFWMALQATDNDSRRG